MRKLKLQVQITIDGYIAGLNGEMDWMEWNWDDELKEYVADLTEPVDCIIHGRKLAEGFIPHWARVVAIYSPQPQCLGNSSNGMACRQQITNKIQDRYISLHQ